MPNILTIRDWDEIFENNKSRSISQCSFCCLPNKQDGLGYSRLVTMENGPALYGAFVAVVLSASKQPSPRHGHLTDTGRALGRPLSAADLSLKTRFPEVLVKQMLTAVTSVEINWILEWDPSASEVPPGCHLGVLKEGRKERTEGKKEDGASASPPPSIFPDGDDAALLQHLQKQACYQHINVRDEFQKMQNWCAVKRQKPTHRRFIAWLNRCEKPMDKSIAPARNPNATTLAEIQKYCREKWGDDPRHQNWALSFHRYWSDPKVDWKKQGKSIDWKIELSTQVSKWKASSQ